MIVKKLSFGAKMTLAFASVVVILVLSIIISVMEYKNMSSYVSDLIADDISSVGVAQNLSDIANQFNLDILAKIGDQTSNSLPSFDENYFVSHCDSLRSSLPDNTIKNLADSVMYSYSAYMLTALELEDVLQSDFIDTRSWYFERLQPRFRNLTSSIDNLISSIYDDLAQNSVAFDNGFYRSIVPGMVSVGAAILLLVMLLYFMLSSYVRPFNRMNRGLQSYLKMGKHYSLRVDTDDQFSELNRGISDLCEQNSILQKRIRQRNER